MVAIKEAPHTTTAKVTLAYAFQFCENEFILQKSIERFSGLPFDPGFKAITLHGQVTEISPVVKERADLPAGLIGFSWGAWLSYIVWGGTIVAQVVHIALQK